MNYKLHLYTETEDGTASWLPLFLDVSMIDGFYQPILEEHEVPNFNRWWFYDSNAGRTHTRLSKQKI